MSSRYYDGRGDQARVRAFELKGGDVRAAPTEELVIDRIGQWEASDRNDTALAEQIRSLLLLACDLDEPYILGRVKEESGAEIALDEFR